MNKNSNKTIELWTDGSAVPNPGRGGYAVLDSQGNPLALGGSEKGFEEKTTNIRMEAQALIAAYKCIRECQHFSTSDLSYSSSKTMRGESAKPRGETSPCGLGLGEDIWRAEGKVARDQLYTINTDSQFWINVVTQWAPGWEAKGWKKSGGAIKNLDLVQELYSLYKTTQNVQLKWVRGHVGTELNEKADEWAAKARQGVRV